MIIKYSHLFNLYLTYAFRVGAAHTLGYDGMVAKNRRGKRARYCVVACFVSWWVLWMWLGAGKGMYATWQQGLPSGL